MIIKKNKPVLKDGILFTIMPVLMIFLLPLISRSNTAEDMFPELKGWELIVGEKVYTPDDLWDIINGAADAYLSYDFQRLYTAEYSDGQDNQIRVYVFEHSDPVNAYGIYSQERSADYEIKETGAQGFASGNAYYFITGPYYIQISSNNDGLDEQLAVLAELTEKKFDQRNELPPELEIFPEKGKVFCSEKYIANNFLGYGFLHSAFVADYEQGEESFRVFIISPGSEKEAEVILNDYLDFVEFSKDKRDKNQYRIEDPYNGSVLLCQTGKYLCGITGADNDTGEEYFEMLKSRLE